MIRSCEFKVERKSNPFVGINEKIAPLSVQDELASARKGGSHL